MQEESRNIYSVSTINRLLKSVLVESFPKSLWVRGEVKDFKKHSKSGHYYFDLIEQEEGKTKAKLSCAFFLGMYRRFERKLEEMEIAPFLKNDIEICVLGKVDFYEPYGKLTFVIQDVDPMYTIGKLSEMKRRNRVLLQKEGLYAQNKQLPRPLVPLCIGLVTASNSAAEADFLKELSASGFGFTVLVRYALMQGKKTESDVPRAIASLEAMHPDVICIVRGGGSFTDLSHFDALDIAKAIALAKVPIVVGVGHEKDLSLADEVAYSSCKTPTKAAQVLVEEVSDFLRRSEATLGLVVGQAKEGIEEKKNHLNRMVHEMIQRSSLGLEQTRTMFERRSQTLLRLAQNYVQRSGEELTKVRFRLQSSLSLLFARHDQTLNEYRNRLRVSISPLFFKRKEEKMEEGFQRVFRLVLEILRRAEEKQMLIQAKIESRDPRAILRKGYALVFQEGRIVKRKKALILRHPIAIRFYDGITKLELRRSHGETKSKEL